ncbi:beta-lactamase/D-alanine carboxypeptidase [Pseudomonas fluorescens]|uniref:Beta-lactamase n=1 Tax=Pseudomonas fluorescens TaxID=294 RepID=A0A379ICQ2_PSEFL|nr:class C beta-lactamase [Pseudomonas fluorescens]AIG01009.1 beta-lactamase/D-alanine carboxypeptidase [Pseudomonas fluorescens]SUD30625.1 beta-lactamase/D-alanine carboxypeptidase [Pseudomonas fluorescens]
MYEHMRNVTILGLLLGAGNCMAATDIRQAVDATIKPLMQQQAIPGLAVAILHNGKTQYFNYGVAAKDSQRPVTENTLFEIGSISKTFTATLAGYAQATGKLKLSEPASHYLPALRGSLFDHISVLNLGTYTAGGLPLQFPPEADNAQQMVSYFQHWKADFAPGTQRQYSNPSLGLFGYLAAQSLQQPFDVALEQTLLPRLGLKHTYLTVPKAQMGLYAQGYDKAGKPVRVSPGALDSEAYGVKTSPADLARYMALNIDPTALEQPLQQAIAATHTGYYTVGNTTQGLGWEMYPYPLGVDELVAGNSTPMAMEPHPVNWLAPAQPLRADTLVNKTGSTGGFGAYIAYVPSKGIGVVILGNKNYPNAERVKAAHAILQAMEP